MKTILIRSLLAVVFALTFTFPIWAADQAKSTDMKQEKSVKHSQSSDDVKKIQEALKSKGNDPGAIDGHMGRKTRAALRAFQKSNGLKVTGSLDKETEDKLGVQLTTSSEAQPMKEEKK